MSGDTFQPWMIPVARKCFELGATDDDVAEAIGRAPSTTAVYFDKYPEFGKTREMKELPDAEVVRSLYKSALGYDTKDGKHVTANPIAQIFWLKNRQKRQWRDKQEHEHSGAVGAPVDPHTIAEQLVTQANANPTLRPVILAWAEQLVDRLKGS